MHAGGEFRSQRGIYHAMSVDAALPPEGFRHNIYAEVRFPFGPVTGMAFVLVGLVHHVQAFGRESFNQLSRDYIFRLHQAGRKRHLVSCQGLKQAPASPHNNRL
jgi:hypothetical protein